MTTRLPGRGVDTDWINCHNELDASLPFGGARSRAEEMSGLVPESHPEVKAVTTALT